MISELCNEVEIHKSISFIRHMLLDGTAGIKVMEDRRSMLLAFRDKMGRCSISTANW